MNALLQIYREGVTHDEGLQRALGLDTAELDRQWQAWLAPWALQKVDPNRLPPLPAAAPTVDLIARVRELADSVWGRR